MPSYATCLNSLNNSNNVILAAVAIVVAFLFELK